MLDSYGTVSRGTVGRLSPPLPLPPLPRPLQIATNNDSLLTDYTYSIVVDIVVESEHTEILSII